MMGYVGMNDTKWDEIERLLKVGWTYSQIKEFSRVREEDIKKIDNYLKNKEVATNERDDLLQ